jgi:hypothetical protein
MKLLKAVIALAILALGLTLTTKPSFGKPEFSKKEKKGCTVCHVKMGSKELNEAGKYYKAHNYSLEGYKEKK